MFSIQYFLLLISKLLVFRVFLNSFNMFGLILDCSLYNNILNLKTLHIFKFKILNDFTAVHFVGRLKEFILFYYLMSLTFNSRAFIKIFLKKDDLSLSLSSIFSNSAWLEREIWDLYGLKFIYHVDLRRLLTDYGFKGHPLLKTFPLSGFYELRYDDIEKKVIDSSVEFSQDFRNFYFNNAWSTIV